MLNLTVPIQVKTLADQPAANNAPDHSRSNESTNKEFSNVLARETSEKKANSEKKSDSENPVASEKATAAEKTADSEKAPTSENTAHSEKTTTSETDNSVNSSKSLPDASSPNSHINQHISSSQGGLLLGTQNHEIQQATPFIFDESNPGVEATPPFAFAPLSGLNQNKQPSQETGQILNATHPSSNLFLQQNPTQSSLLNNNMWQPLGTADFAVSGKNLSFYAEANKAIFANAGESTLSSLTDSASTQQPGLNSFSSILSTTAAPQDLSLDTQVGQPKWGNDFAQKIVWLSNQQNQVAEIRLNPAHLGPVEVMLNITSEQATAQFASPHAAVREAIEAALPRLREMMAESGIELGSVTVGSDSFQQQEQTNQHAQSSSGNGQNMAGNGEESIDPVETRMSPNRHQGLVNTFA